MNKTLGQKIAFAFAILSYLAAVGCAVAAAKMSDSPLLGSIVATVVFFVSCGVVLHVIANARLKGILNAAPQDHDAAH